MILDPGDYARWFGERPVTATELEEMFRPYPVKEMKAIKIGLKIDTVKNQGPELIEPVA